MDHNRVNGTEPLSPPASDTQVLNVDAEAFTGLDQLDPAPDDNGEVSQLGKTQYNLKRLAVTAAIMLGVSGAVFAVLVLTNVIPLIKFRTINYDNGKGAHYNLKFYSRYSVKNVAGSLPSAPGATISPDLLQLASKTPGNGKAPLTLWVTTTPNITEATGKGSYSSNDCTKHGLPRAFTARVDYINADVPVCAIGQEGTDVIYMTMFHNQTNGYLAYFAQDVDFSALLSSYQAAQAGQIKVGLADYQDDIKTILGSLKPIE